MGWDSIGFRGGDCWGNEAESYSNDEPDFEVLDLVLAELRPNITYLDYKKVNKLIREDTDSEWEYYGNSTTYEVKFIILNDLINLLKD